MWLSNGFSSIVVHFMENIAAGLLHCAVQWGYLLGELIAVGGSWIPPGAQFLGYSIVLDSCLVWQLPEISAISMCDMDLVRKVPGPGESSNPVLT